MPNNNPKTVLFPGSFDPFTAGHEFVVRRALEIFDRVVIAVGVNPSKHGLLTPENRIKLIKDIFGNDSRVVVSQYTGLTIDECHRAGAEWIVRGLRSTADYESESALALVNRRLASDIETVFVCASPELSVVSSSAIREIVRFGGNPKEFMPSNIDLKNYL